MISKEVCIWRIEESPAIKGIWKVLRDAPDHPDKVIVVARCLNKDVAIEIAAVFNERPDINIKEEGTE